MKKLLALILAALLLCGIVTPAFAEEADEDYSATKTAAWIQQLKEAPTFTLKAVCTDYDAAKISVTLYKKNDLYVINMQSLKNPFERLRVYNDGKNEYFSYIFFLFGEAYPADDDCVLMQIFESFIPSYEPDYAFSSFTETVNGKQLTIERFKWGIIMQDFVFDGDKLLEIREVDMTGYEGEVRNELNVSIQSCQWSAPNYVFFKPLFVRWDPSSCSNGT